MKKYLTINNLINALGFISFMGGVAIETFDLAPQGVSAITFIIAGCTYWINTNKGY